MCIIQQVQGRVAIWMAVAAYDIWRGLCLLLVLCPVLVVIQSVQSGWEPLHIWSGRQVHLANKVCTALMQIAITKHSSATAVFRPSWQVRSVGMPQPCQGNTQSQIHYTLDKCPFVVCLGGNHRSWLGHLSALPPRYAKSWIGVLVQPKQEAGNEDYCRKILLCYCLLWLSGANSTLRLLTQVVEEHRPLWWSSWAVASNSGCVSSTVATAMCMLLLCFRGLICRKSLQHNRKVLQASTSMECSFVSSAANAVPALSWAGLGI